MYDAGRMTFDVELARRFFPPLDSGVAYLENAGRALMARPVIERLHRFVVSHPVQPEWPHKLAAGAREMIEAGRRTAAALLGAEPGEVVIGPSTTLNVYVLAHAIAASLEPGRAIVVTNQDHEANSGAWRRLAAAGFEIREWRVDPTTGSLEPSALDDLLDDRVALVCFPHVSNVVGTINDVPAITAKAHAVGARVCVDGVAYAPHRLVDVGRWGVDFYLCSLYKIYGPHLGLMYVRPEHLEGLANQSHFFHADASHKKLNPGGLQYEAVASIAGIGDYIGGLGGRSSSFRERVAEFWEDVAAHEEHIVAPLLAFLRERDDVRLLGCPEPDRDRRVPTVSFRPRRAPREVLAAFPDDVAIGAGDFYAPRCLEGVGIDPKEGVVRISLVHYNTESDVDRAIRALQRAL